MNLDWIVIPLMGGLIGLITNGIALKMLFWPLEAVKIGKFTLPFTPGLIPKEKPRIAKSLGEVIARKLLNEEVIADTLKSEIVQDKINALIDQILDRYRQSELTVREEIENLLSKEGSDNLIDSLKENAEKILEKQLLEFSFGESIVKEALNQHFEEEKGLKKKIMDEKMIAALSKSLGKILNKAISSNAHAIVGKLVDQECEKLLNVKAKKLAEHAEKHSSEIKKQILSKYQEIIDQNLSRILNTIDIAKMIEARINGFDVEELEKMILTIVHKELHALVYLGGILGVVMGFVTCLFQQL